LEGRELKQHDDDLSYVVAFAIPLFVAAFIGRYTSFWYAVVFWELGGFVSWLLRRPPGTKRTIWGKFLVVGFYAVFGWPSIVKVWLHKLFPRLVHSER
jgi:hypothetical protein